MPKRGPRAPLCNEVASVILASDVPLKMSALAVALGVVVPGAPVPTNIGSVLRLRLRQLLSAGKISYTGELATRVYHAPTACAESKAKAAARMKAQTATRTAAAKANAKDAAVDLAAVRAKARSAAKAKAADKADKALAKKAARAKAKFVVRAAAEAKAKDKARDLAEAAAQTVAKSRAAAEAERASVRATWLKSSPRNHKRRSPVARAAHPAVMAVLDAHPWSGPPGFSEGERDALALFDCLIG